MKKIVLPSDILLVARSYLAVSFLVVISFNARANEERGHLGVPNGKAI